jgi:hypothetical protein
MKKPATEMVLARVAGPLAVWVVTRLLQQPSVKGALRRADSRALDQRDKARRGLQRAGKNMRSNPIWVAAGLVSIVVGIGLITRAARRT